MDQTQSLLAAIALVLGSGLQVGLSAPSAHPMEIDFSRDPVLQLRHRETDEATFRALMSATVARHPLRAEAAALQDEAEALLDQAREARLPTVDATLNSYRVISRDFSNDPENILERARPARRTDVLLQVQQTLFDFGAGASRVRAGGARLRAAAADVEAVADRVVLGAVAAWYDIFGYRALIDLADAFLASQRDLRAAVEERIRLGASAEGDLARIDSYIAQTHTRLARFHRILANAEARFTELVGSPPPPGLGRVPAPALAVADRDDAINAARSAPGVRSAEANSEAARQEALAARADRLPQISAGIDAGRYGLLETDRDYDVRARVTLRQRLFGGINPRATQYDARARAADARADRIREEAARDAAIGWADVSALEQQLESVETAYVASRRSRDVIVERFRAARGTLFDVVAAEEAYFESATAFIQALAELDAARYVLLSRTGRLLAQLGIPAAASGPDR